MKNLLSFTIFGLLITLLLIEALTILWTPAGQGGFVLWTLSFGILFSFSVFKYYTITRSAFSNKNFILLITLSFFIFLTLLNTPFIFNSNSETAQEIGCTLNHITENQGMGYRETCLFGYPARQFFIPSLPSLLLGRDTLSLNIGSSLYFIMGLILFANGIFSNFKKFQHPELLTSILVTGIFHFYFVVWFLFGYEQSIYPLSFTLAATGLFLLLKKSLHPIIIGLIGITNAFLIFSYTSGLATLMLSMVLLSVVFFVHTQNIKQKILCLFVIIFSLGMLASSFFIRTDLSLSGSSERGLQLLLEDVTYGLKGILTNTLPTRYMSWFVYPLFLFSCISLLFVKKKLYFLFFVAWGMGVILLSIVSKGYSYYVVEFRLHRSIIIIPVFLILLGYSLNQLPQLKISKKIIYSAILLYMFTGALFYNYQNITEKIGSERHRHTAFIQTLKYSLAENKTHGLLLFSDDLYTLENYYKNFISINDSLRYYLPNLKACSVSECYHSRTLYKNVYLATTHPSPEGRHITTFSFQDDTLIHVFVLTNQ